MEPEPRDRGRERGSGRASTSTRRSRESQRQRERSRSKGGEREGKGQVSWYIGRQKREEKEKEEEERGSPHPRKETPGEPVCHYGTRSQSGGPQKGEETSSEGDKEEPQQEKGQPLNSQFIVFEHERRKRGPGGQRSLRAGHTHTESVAPLPRCPHHVDDCRSEGGPVDAAGGGRRSSRRSSSGHSHPVCETGPDAHNEWAGGPGVAPLGTPAGSAFDGCSGRLGAPNASSPWRGTPGE